MSSTSRAWMVAATVGAVEALTDQGICRWNYAFRSLQQHARSSLRSSSYAERKMSSSSSSSGAAISGYRRVREEEEKARRSEESLRTVMYLSCWGPN